MANFKVIVSSSVEKILDKLPKKDLAKIVQLIRTLEIQPRPVGCRKLTGEENTYRVRQGNYRLIYEIRDNVLMILVLKIGHRKDVYRKR